MRQNTGWNGSRLPFDDWAVRDAMQQLQHAPAREVRLALRGEFGVAFQEAATKLVAAKEAERKLDELWGPA